MYERNYFIWSGRRRVPRSAFHVFNTFVRFYILPLFLGAPPYSLLLSLGLFCSLISCVLFSIMYVCQELANFGCFRKEGNSPPPTPSLLTHTDTSQYLTTEKIYISRHTFSLFMGCFGSRPLNTVVPGRQTFPT
jgi:hypothetical protein